MSILKIPDTRESEVHSHLRSGSFLQKITSSSSERLKTVLEMIFPDHTDLTNALQDVASGRPKLSFVTSERCMRILLWELWKNRSVARGTLERAFDSNADWHSSIVSAPPLPSVDWDARDARIAAIKSGHFE